MITVPAAAIRRVLDRCGAPCVETVTAESLHRDCFCLAVDPAAVRDQVNAQLATRGAPVGLTETHAHLFSALPIFVPAERIAEMTSTVRAVTAAVALPAYREAALAWAPPIAEFNPGSPGGLLGFDFHLGPLGPRLIEVNTNPGGFLLNAVLARAQRLCLPDLSASTAIGDLYAVAVDALRDEWQQQAVTDRGGLVVIVDENPTRQYLYAEFVLFQLALEARGFGTALCDPNELEYQQGELRLDGRRVAFVYNRHTDFALEGQVMGALRQAYLDRAVALSPHPRAHALWADKRNLSLLSSADFLQRSGLPVGQQTLLSTVVPRTLLLTPENREELWASRRQWFFKPANGFGSRASYRGDKLTHKTWKQMTTQPYVAQAVVAPSERRTGSDMPILKVDVRCYAYQGEALLFAARLYQGQTTNFRTPGGGFAPVLTLAPE